MHRHVTLAAIVAISTALAQGQNSNGTYRRGSSAINNNRVNRADVSLTYGNSGRTARNYNRYYYQNSNKFQLSPYLGTAAPAAQRRVVLGNVLPYSEEEYGRLLLSTMNAPSLLPSGTKGTTMSLAQEDDSESAQRRYKVAETRVLDTLDRGVILAATGEEIKLRGIRMPSEKSHDDVIRYYAHESIKALRDLTTNQTIYVLLDDPLRDNDGTLLGDVYLADGTEINKLMLQAGYGTLNKSDFAPDGDFSEFAAAETLARENKVGVWSK